MGFCYDYGPNHRNKSKVGVALSGGGLRGIAHIGVLKVLNDANIPIDMISGTSAGAIIAAMFACGYSPAKMEQIAYGIDPIKFADFKLNAPSLIKHGLKWFLSGKFRFMPTGLIKGTKIEEYLTELWQKQTMRDTKIPLAITSVDINSADTVFFTTPIPGKRAILNARYYHNIRIAEAVRCSISIPGIFLPKKIRGMTLVDGAVKNNLPTDILHHMGAEKIIAVDLGYAGQAKFNIHSVSEVLLQCIDIMSREVTLLKAEQFADIIIRPIIEHEHSKRIEKCIQIGEQAAIEGLPLIKKLLK